MAATGVFQADRKGQLIPVRIKTLEGTEIDLYDESHALVIGVSNYKKPLRSLPGVERDVTEISAALRRHGFNVEPLMNPSRAAFDQAMRRFIRSYGQSPGSRLLIYFAGHGHTLKTIYGPQGYLVPADAPPADDVGQFKEGAISMDEIEVYVRQIESKHVLFVFDSCFSGSLFEALERSDLPPVISNMTTKPVRQFITAGTAEQPVPDKSIFRQQFVEGLGGQADLNRDGYVTGSELAMFLEDKVMYYSKGKQTPQYGKIRDLDLDRGDFVFVLPKSSQPAPLPPEKPSVAGMPKIRITLVPPSERDGGDGTREDIEGEVSGVDPGEFRVVLYAWTDKWYVQPEAGESFTEIAQDGKWKTWTHTGSKYAALLVKPTFKPPTRTSILPGVGGNVLAVSTVMGKPR